MDGTLVDSERVHWQAWHDTLQGHGLRVPVFDVFDQYVGVSDEHMAEEFTEDFVDSAAIKIDPATLISEKRTTYLRLVPEIKLLPGVTNIIKRYQGRYRMAVASSSPYDELISILEYHHLHKFFEYVVGGDMVTKKKPNPEIYLQVTSKLGLSPAQCIAFEDSQSGIAAAKGGGLLAVAVPHTMSMNHDFSEADIKLTSLFEVDDQLLTQLADSVG